MMDPTIEFKPIIGMRVRVKDDALVSPGQEGEVIGEVRWGAQMLVKVLLDSGRIEARRAKDFEEVMP